MTTEAEVVEEVLRIVEKELTIEEYARFLAAITPKVGDSVEELRQYREKATYEEILERLRRKGAKIMP